MTVKGELGAGIVWVTHSCPAATKGVYRALNPQSYRDAGRGVMEIWAVRCPHPDRFVGVGTARFSGLRGGGHQDRYCLDSHDRGLAASVGGER